MHPGALHGDLGELVIKFQDKSADAGIRYEEVRPRAYDPYLHAQVAGPGQDGLELPPRCPGRRTARRARPVRIVVSRASG